MQLQCMALIVHGVMMLPINIFSLQCLLFMLVHASMAYSQEVMLMWCAAQAVCVVHSCPKSDGLYEILLNVIMLANELR